MYSTLAAMSQFKACVPGFTRQASFYGIQAKKAGTKIPLHVIALLGGSEDAGWAAGHALFIDKEEFAAFRKRTILRVWRKHLYDCVFKGRHSRDNIVAFLRDASGKDTVLELLGIVTLEALEVKLDQMEWSKFGSSFLNEVFTSWLYSPAEYIKHVVDSYSHNTSWDDKNGPPEFEQMKQYMINYLISEGLDPSTPVQLESAYPAKKKVATPARSSGWDEDEEEDDESEEEDERPRRAVPVRATPTPRPGSTAARAAAARLEADQALETATGTTSVVGKKGKKAKVVEPPKLSVPRKYFLWTERAKYVESNMVIAHILHPDPYAFMLEMEFRAPKSLTVNKEDGCLVIRVTENKQAFDIMRALTKRPSDDSL